METSNIKKKANNYERDSGIELFRIITMMIIVAHHYVVNSGLTPGIFEEITPKNLFLLLAGCGGKIGINCFVFITGYFMCKSNITLKKFLKLLVWIETYKVIFYLIFTITGYQEFTFKDMVKSLLPISSVGTGFSSAYLIFYMFIPFINILVNNMTKKQHLLLILLSVSVYSILPMFLIPVTFNYVTWFTVIYFVASYVRLYPIDLYNNKKLWGFATISTVLLCWLSVVLGAIINTKFGYNIAYFCVTDSNKILALLTAFSSFMFFKNLKIGRIKMINVIATSTYGVLLIHANSDTMRKWLWNDVFNNVGVYNEHGLTYIIGHLVFSVLVIYIVCTIIDQLRLIIVEKPIFSFLERKNILK